MIRILKPSDEIVNRLVDRRPACASRNIYRSGEFDFIILSGFIVAVIAIVLLFFFVLDFGGTRSVLKTVSTESTTNASSTDTTVMAHRVQRGQHQKDRPLITAGITKHLRSSRAATRTTTIAPTKYCDGAGCEELAEQLLSSIDTKVDPCANFYHYVCGGWLEQHQLHLGGALVSEAELHRRQMEQQMLTEMLTGTDDESLKWPLRLWEKCRAGEGEPFSHDVFRNILKTHGLDGFPFREKVSLSVAHRAANVLRLSGIPAFADVRVTKVKDSDILSKWVAKIDPPAPIFRTFVKMRDIHDEWYLSAVERIFAPRPLPQFLKLEQALVDLAGQRKDAKNYARVHVYKLIHNRHWNWTQFLHTVLKGVVKISKYTEVIVKGGSFQRQLIKIAENFGPANLLNYLVFRMYIHYSLFLNHKDFEGLAAISGSRIPGWEDGDSAKDVADLRCLRMLARNMPELYVFIYWNAFLRNRKQLTTSIDAMVEHSVNEALQYVEQLNITPSLTKNFRSDMFNSRKQIFIPEWLERQKLRAQYSNLIFEDTEDSPLISWNDILEAQECNALRKITDNGFETFWSGSLFDDDPWYDTDEGTLTVRIAAVEANYSGDAFLVHHVPRLAVAVVHAALSHLADLAFSHKSNYPTVHLKLELLKDCLKKHNYRNRPSSDIASHADALDLLSLPAALAVFRRHVARGSANFQLRGVSSNDTDQLFFLEFALGRCERYDDGYLHQRMHDGVRSPAPYFVNGPLRNFRGFARAFHCPKGSYMNPKRICHL